MSERTVLLVDDDEMVRDGMCRLIEAGGFHCVTADHAAQALSMLPDCGAQVVVADYDMPGMDGVTMLREIATRFPSIVRILLTGRKDAEPAVRAINEAHAYRFLSKPCKGADIRAALQLAFQAVEAEAELRRLQSTRAMAAAVSKHFASDPVPK